MVKLLSHIPWVIGTIVLLPLWLMYLVITPSLVRLKRDHLISQALRELHHIRQQEEVIIKFFADQRINLSNSVQDRMTNSNLSNHNVNESSLAYDLENSRKPTLAYEKARRRIQTDIEEMWYFMSVQIKLLQQKVKSPEVAIHLNTILTEGVEYKRSLLHDVAKLTEVDGYKAWRFKEAEELSDLVQRRLQYIQNPPNCYEAKELVCPLNRNCGYGCHLHHVVKCLIIAYGTKRTFIIRNNRWKYTRKNWEVVFKPVSDTCATVTESLAPWPGDPESPIVYPIETSNSTPFYPLVVPKDLADRIKRLHGHPSVWWVGQFLKYLLRPQQATTDVLKDAADQFKFQHPIVGVQIRRTDKIGLYAAFHSVDEYMMHVEEYYKQLYFNSTGPIVKRIYLASDDATVFPEIISKYPEYQVLGDIRIARSAAIHIRFMSNSFYGILKDINFLSLTDYLVCTFSSNVCRAAYEIMQSLHPDASIRFRSLDKIYFYLIQDVHQTKAVLAHKAKSSEELDMEVGDIIGVTANHWNGSSTGSNLRSNKSGLFPSFKVDDVVETEEFPTYAEVPLGNLEED